MLTSPPKPHAFATIPVQSSFIDPAILAECCTMINSIMPPLAELSSAPPLEALVSHNTGGSDTAAPLEALVSHNTGGSDTAAPSEALVSHNTGGSDTVASSEALVLHTAGSETADTCMEHNIRLLDPNSIESKVDKFLSENKPGYISHSAVIAQQSQTDISQGVPSVESLEQFKSELR